VKNEHNVRFEKWALENNRKEIKRIVLENNQLAGVIFNM